MYIFAACCSSSRFPRHTLLPCIVGAISFKLPRGPFAFKIRFFVANIHSRIFMISHLKVAALLPFRWWYIFRSGQGPGSRASLDLTHFLISLRNRRLNILPSLPSHRMSMTCMNPKLPHSFPHPPRSLGIDFPRITSVIRQSKSLLRRVQVCNLHTSNSWFAHKIHGCDVDLGIFWQAFRVTHQHFLRISDERWKPEVDVVNVWTGDV
jgi:hypothetical protein